VILSEGYRSIIGLAADPPADDVTVEVYESLRDAAPFLRGVAIHPGPWTFDVETYDAAKFPSRKEVAVDPYHPDFRVRGVAIALSATFGGWVEFRGVDGDAVVPLRAAFASDAEKGAFNGGFDESALVYNHIVPVVRNRTRDGYLAMIALGDGSQRQEQHVFRLETAVTKILKHSQYWGLEKSMMRELPTKAVAYGAVRDACRTHELCDLLDERAAAGQYIEWSAVLG
jgi:hypothetical protein